MTDQITLHGVKMNLAPGQRPVQLDGQITVPALFAARCAELGEQTAHREKDLGIWKSYSWRDYWDHARWIGLGLRSLGLERGQAVSILSEDCKEWLYVDLGVQCVGGISSGIYTTDSAAQLAYLVNDSDSRFLFVENEEQLDKYLSSRDKMPNLERVIIFDPEGLHDLDDPRCMFLTDLYKLGQEHDSQHPDLFADEVARAQPQDTAILIYTSGTTGPPKGAMLSHENILAAIEATSHCLPTLPTDEQLCFLPLCHVLERSVSVYAPLAFRTKVNFAESPETVFANLQEVSPTTFTAVPRVWEKIQSRVMILAQEATWTGRRAFDLAQKAGQARARFLLQGQAVPALVQARYQIWDLLVLRNLRRMLGLDRLRRATTGAAPISPDLLMWYWSIGVPLIEGFGMTETTSVATVNTLTDNRVGTIGRAIPGSGLRIAEDGEIQVSGLHIFKGYWRNNAKTAETFTADGWLRTGDAGQIDQDGFVRITGRIKDIIITAGGKNIAPAEIESGLKFSPYISDAVIIGDRRKYLTALIMIDQENVERYAQGKRVPFSDFASLCAAPEVAELIRTQIDAVNKDFARVEQIKDFRLINVLLTAEDEELTATMKLRRSCVEDRHKELIDAMY